MVAVPPELAALRQWVVWKLTTRKGKTTKVPHRARDGRLASTTSPDDWCSLEEALEATEHLGMDGIGFVFSKDDPYCGADLDHCVDDAGEIHPKAWELIEAIGSYAEISPSGTGVHVIFKAHLGAGRRTKNTEWGGNFEAYDNGRYFTFTGQSLNGLEIREGALTLDVTDDSDLDIVDRCRRHSTGFMDLYYEGDTSEYEDDHSRADLALANMLAARTLDPDQIERIMQQSALAREKWGHPDTGSTWLRRRVIEPAIRDSGKKDKDKGTGFWSGDFEKDVAQQQYMLEVREEARIRYRTRGLPADLGLTNMPLSEELLLPEPDEIARIGGKTEEAVTLQFTGYNCLLIAPNKSGKTALNLNLLKSLADGTPFLGKYEITPFQGNICVFNYEEMPIHWRRHVARLGIQNTDRIWVQHRRGQPILPIWEKRSQDRVVKWMIDHEIAYWIVDPTAVAWQGLVDNENDNTLVAAFTTALDQVKERAGIGEMLLTHHTGRMDDSRGRGAIRLDDWKDVSWHLNRDDVTNVRTFWATGREIEVEKFELDWNEDKWRLSAGEDIAAQKKKDRVKTLRMTKQAVIELLDEHGDMSQTSLGHELRDSGYSFNQNELGKTLMRWAGDADNRIAYKEKKTRSGTTRMYFLEGEC